MINNKILSLIILLFHFVVSLLNKNSTKKVLSTLLQYYFAGLFITNIFSGASMFSDLLYGQILLILGFVYASTINWKKLNIGKTLWGSKKGTLYLRKTGMEASFYRRVCVADESSASSPSIRVTNRTRSSETPDQNLVDSTA